jgi:hypothetical protein
MIERYRPHHIVCERFMKVEFPERGVEFTETQQRRKDLIESNDNTLVEPVEGVDNLCAKCPDCHDGRCSSPLGGEEAVRKWDVIILKGLGVEFGEARTPEGWRRLMEEKLPFDFCRNRCGYRTRCSVFSLPDPTRNTQP